jgi:hypothetical protein
MRKAKFGKTKTQQLSITNTGLANEFVRINARSVNVSMTGIRQYKKIPKAAFHLNEPPFSFKNPKDAKKTTPMEMNKYISTFPSASRHHVEQGSHTS